MVFEIDGAASQPIASCAARYRGLWCWWVCLWGNAGELIVTWECGTCWEAYRWMASMASINVRVDDDLKARAYRELERLGVTPSELMRQVLQYVAERGQLPFKPVLMTEDDEALLATVRERLAAPQRVTVSIDDL